MPTQTAQPSRKTERYLLTGILLIAMNLRAPFTGIAPLLDTLKSALGLTATQAGLLITLPLLAFAAVSPLAAGMARRWGIERTLLLALGLIAIGILLRAAGPVTTLYLGTGVIGSGIAMGNVLLPSLLKRDFPLRVPALTAAYVLTMGIAAAGTSALTIPLAHWLDFDWRLVTGASLLLPIVAGLIWLPQIRHSAAGTASDTSAPARVSVWGSALAWQVTLFMALDCFLYYVGVSWLPAILHDAGYSTTAAGSLHGVLLLATALPGLLLIPLIPRLPDQRAIAIVLSLCIASGLGGLLLIPQWAGLWILCFGFGAGGGLILALSFISLRTHDAQTAAGLSGMAQSIGYLLAAGGPPLIGALHEHAANWATPLTLCIGLSMAMAMVGLYAGRQQQINTADITLPSTGGLIRGSR